MDSLQQRILYYVLVVGERDDIVTVKKILKNKTKNNNNNNNLSLEWIQQTYWSNEIGHKSIYGGGGVGWGGG